MSHLETGGAERGSFTHDEMSDASKQIRLLVFQPGSSTDPIVLHMETHYLNKAPDYIGISYTWGSEDDPQVVTINGSPMAVRKNCHYALWQARLHYPGGAVWVDSICINQTDLQEKSYQVAMMYDIYIKSVKVLACVGPHADGSEELFSLAKVIAESDGPKDRDYWIDHLRREMSLEDSERLISICMAFDKRRYWGRLWIVQEVLAAGHHEAHSVDICSGIDRVAWSGVETVLQGTVQSFPRSEWHTSRVAQIAKWFQDPRTLNLREIISLYKWGFQCTEKLDYVFALSRVVQWPADSKPIQPDYTKPLLDLLAKLFDILNYAAIVYESGHLFGPWGVTPDDPHLQAGWAWRRSQKPPTSSTQYGNDERWRAFGTTKLAHLCQDPSGVLVIRNQSLTERRPVVESAAQKQYMAELSAAWSAMVASLLDTMDGPLPRQVAHNSDPSRTVGVLCSGARRGDVLIENPCAESDALEPVLVLRHSNSDKYDLVGQGFVHCDSFRQMYTDGSGGEIDCELRATSDDCLLLASMSLAASRYKGAEQGATEISRRRADMLPSLFAPAIAASDAAVTIRLENPADPMEKWLAQSRIGILPAGRAQILKYFGFPANWRFLGTYQNQWHLWRDWEATETYIPGKGHAVNIDSWIRENLTPGSCAQCAAEKQAAW